MSINKNVDTNRHELRIISNLPRLDGFRTRRFSVAHQFDGHKGTWWSGVRLFIRAFRYDVVVLDNESRRLLVSCLLRWLLPFQRCRLVSVDLVLLTPSNWKQRLAARFKRSLLRRVDGFILYFTDWNGYERFYGISPARCWYVPFKVNSWEALPPLEQLSADGDYVASPGRTHRDFRTFVAAMRQLDYPATLLHQNSSLRKQYGADLDLSNLPSNVRVEEDDSSNSRWLEYIRRAKVVVIPTLPSTISAAGISTYLLAMGLRKCVIVTEGPATRDLLTDQAIVVPPNDPVALADAIRRAWEDKDLRERTADAGRRYAEQLGDYKRLLSDIVDVCGQLVMAGRSTSGGQARHLDGRRVA